MSELDAEFLGSPDERTERDALGPARRSTSRARDHPELVRDPRPSQGRLRPVIPAGACVPEKSLVFGLEPRQPPAHDVHSRCEAPEAVEECLRPPPKLQRLGQRSHAELRHLIPPPVIFDKALQLTTRLVVL